MDIVENESEQVQGSSSETDYIEAEGFQGFVQNLILYAARYVRSVLWYSIFLYIWLNSAITSILNFFLYIGIN